MFELTDRQIIFDTGLSRDELEQAKKDLVGRVLFLLGWVKLLHSDKYNNYVTNPKMEVALSKEIALVPDEILKGMNGYDTSMDTSIYTPNNHKSEIINKKSYSDIDSLNQELCTEVATEYSVGVKAVTGLAEDLRLYCKSKGKKYSNYKAALQSWVRRAIDVKKITKIVDTSTQPEEEYYDPEIAKQNLAKIMEMKKKLLS